METCEELSLKGLGRLSKVHLHNDDIGPVTSPVDIQLGVFDGSSSNTTTQPSTISSLSPRSAAWSVTSDSSAQNNNQRSRLPVDEVDENSDKLACVSAPEHSSSTESSPIISPRSSPGIQRKKYGREEMELLRKSPHSNEKPKGVPEIPGVTVDYPARRRPRSAQTRSKRSPHYSANDPSQSWGQRGQYNSWSTNHQQQARKHFSGPELRWGYVTRESDLTANLYQFLTATSPSFSAPATTPQPMNYATAATRTTASPPPDHGFSVDLSELWEFFDQPCGHEIPISFNRDPSTRVNIYFVPHLSALQIYRADSLADATPAFEFFETRTPDLRPPLLEQIEILAKTYPTLLTATTKDLDHVKSWFAVSWYPILSCKRTAQALSGTFLTYHAFRLDTHPFGWLLDQPLPQRRTRIPCPCECTQYQPQQSSLGGKNNQNGEMVMSSRSRNSSEPRKYYITLRGFVPYKILAETWYAPVSACLHQRFEVLYIPVNLVQSAVTFVWSMQRQRDMQGNPWCDPPNTVFASSAKHNAKENTATTTTPVTATTTPASSSGSNRRVSVPQVKAMHPDLGHIQARSLRPAVICDLVRFNIDDSVHTEHS